MTKRIDVKTEYKWNIEEIFASEKEWDELFDEVSSELDFSKYEQKLSDADTLLECFKELDRVALKLEKLSVYAFMRHDEDTANSFYNGKMSQIDSLEVTFSSNTAFIMPELTALSEEKLMSFIKDERFSDYDYELKNIIKSKPHVLSKETESVLALGGQVFQGFHSIFSMIDNADLPFPELEVDGEKLKVTHGTYSVLLQSSDRTVREKAFKAYYNAYYGLLNTISATYIGNVNKNVFLTRARKYNSCLERALISEDVDKVVYDNLISATNKALPILHKYVENKKKTLKLDEMHMYDMYVPIVENQDLKLDFVDAFKLVKKGLEPLGKEYQDLLQRAFDERWMDVFETENKRSGAYSIHVYAIKHPYVLLNYQKTTHDIFTIAHELGHSMHSYFSSKNQPQSKADYKIFVAEVASTVNEVLLLKYMLKNTDDVMLKKFLLSYYMDMIKGTLFRQTMFAEFEYKVHSLAEQNIPLTKDLLNEIYLGLNQEYYGESVISDDEIKYEWARIPHFYRAFYVYKYATGIISAISIAERIYSEGENAVKDYYKFLSSGGSDSPVELLKLAGVDLTKTCAFESAMNSFKNALEEFEKL